MHCNIKMQTVSWSFKQNESLINSLDSTHKYNSWIWSLCKKIMQMWNTHGYIRALWIKFLKIRSVSHTYSNHFHNEPSSQNYTVLVCGQVSPRGTCTIKHHSVKQSLLGLKSNDPTSCWEPLLLPSPPKSTAYTAESCNLHCLCWCAWLEHPTMCGKCRH